MTDFEKMSMVTDKVMCRSFPKYHLGSEGYRGTLQFVY
jgi:hypothetical protein